MIFKTSIKNWAEADRPREKLLQKGRAALTDTELLAILLGSGSKQNSAMDLARLILKQSDNNLNQLALKDADELMKLDGVGPAKAVNLIAALELSIRRKTDPTENKITSAQDAHRLMYPILKDLGHEEFWLLSLNRRNVVLKKTRISAGGVSGTVVDAKIIFKKAIDHLASGLIVVHNHPSGNPKPSGADVRLTKKLVASGKLLDVAVLDHLIFAGDTFFSFAEEGLI